MRFVEEFEFVGSCDYCNGKAVTMFLFSYYPFIGSLQIGGRKLCSRCRAMVTQMNEKEQEVFFNRRR